MSLIIGLAAALWQWRRAENNAVDLQASRAEEANQFQMLRRHLYNSEMNVVQRAWELADVDRMREVLQRHVPRHNESDLRGFEWYYLWSLTHSAKSELSWDKALPNDPCL